MVVYKVYKEYNNEQYEKFLSHKLGDNFGISKKTFLDNFMKLKFTDISPFTTYGVTRKKLEDEYIPLLKSILGGYVFFLLYSYYEGGGQGNWINHFDHDTSATSYGCMRDDAKYLAKISHWHGSPTMHADEVLNKAPYIEEDPGSTARMLNRMADGTIGRAYMQSTMAGNAWVFGTKWCVAHQGSLPNVYFGNPYDSIIDLIKKMGGDPFGAGGKYDDDDKVPRGDYHPKNPQSIKPKVIKKKSIHSGYIYLNGTLMATGNGDDIKITRYGNMLFIDTGDVKEVGVNDSDGGDAKESGKESDKIPRDNKWERIKKEIDRLKKSHGGQYTYSNDRPQQNPTISGQGDCSGFVGFVIRNVYPQVWAHGVISTGSIFAKFKAMNKVVWAGPANEFPNHYKDVKRGYIIMMGQDLTFGPGLYQHTGIMMGDGADAIFFNQSGGTPPTEWHTTLRQEYELHKFTHPYWGILKI